MKSVLPILAASLLSSTGAGAALLYTNAGPISVNETGAGTNLAGMSLARDNSFSGTLYFSYEIAAPASNMSNENYFAGLQMYDAGAERLGVGNAWGAWAYSAFGAAGGASPDLNSSTPEPGLPYQLVRSTDSMRIVYRVNYVSGANDNVTVWMNPNLSLSEGAQSPSLTTTFAADASFNELHLREGGGGSGWTFSNINISDTGTGPGFFPVPEPGTGLLALLTGIVSLARRRRN